MKKILQFLCVFSLAFCFANPVLAKIDKAASTEYIQLVSHASQPVGKKNEKSAVILDFSHNMSNMGIEGWQHFYILSITTSNDKKTLPVMIFNFHNPPKIQFEQNGSNTVVRMPKRRSQVWSNGISHEPDQTLRAQILAAQKITLLLPCENNSYLSVEIAPQTLAEWKYVISADMEAEQKALMG